jgi:hypothetical protein
LHVEEYIPGLTLIGSDGGGEAFGFDKRSKPWKVVMIPFVALCWEDAKPLANSFTGFLQRLRRGLLGIKLD